MSEITRVLASDLDTGRNYGAASWWRRMSREVLRKRMMREERRLVRTADCIWACSDGDADAFKRLFGHGWLLSRGEKMSKSRGNVVAPQTVMNTLGADVLRLWVAATDYRGEMSVSEEIMRRTADAYRRIRNTARYLLANLDGFEPARDMLAPGEMLILDRWVLNQAAVMDGEFRQAYETYQFHQIYQKLHQFCVIILGNFYLDIIKDRIYTMRRDSIGRRSAQTTLYHIAELFARWIAPILSFTAEEIWHYLPGKREASVFLEEWYQGIPEPGDFDDTAWQRIIEVRDAASKVLERLRAAGAGPGRRSVRGRAGCAS